MLNAFRQSEELNGSQIHRIRPPFHGAQRLSAIRGIKRYFMAGDFLYGDNVLNAFRQSEELNAIQGSIYKGFLWRAQRLSAIRGIKQVLLQEFQSREVVCSTPFGNQRN